MFRRDILFVCFLHCQLHYVRRGDIEEQLLLWDDCEDFCPAIRVQSRPTTTTMTPGSICHAHQWSLASRRDSTQVDEHLQGCISKQFAKSVSPTNIADQPAFMEPPYKQSKVLWSSSTKPTTL